VSAEQLLDGLDPVQREAVVSEAQPLCILAGAGSGKTRVLTRRIALRALTGSALPQHVLALTFTRRAAGELGLGRSRYALGGASPVRRRGNRRRRGQAIAQGNQALAHGLRVDAAPNEEDRRKALPPRICQRQENVLASYLIVLQLERLLPCAVQRQVGSGRSGERSAVGLEGVTHALDQEAPGLLEVCPQRLEHLSSGSRTIGVKQRQKEVIGSHPIVVQLLGPSSCQA